MKKSSNIGRAVFGWIHSHTLHPKFVVKGTLLPILIAIGMGALFALGIVTWGAMTPLGRHSGHAIIVFLFLLTLLLTRSEFKRPLFRYFPESDITLLAALFIVVAAVRFSITTDLVGGFEQILLYLDALLLFATTRMIATHYQLRQVIRAIFLGAAVAAILVAVFRPVASTVSQSGWIIAGPFINNNHFATFIGMLFFFVLAEVFRNLHRRTARQRIAIGATALTLIVFILALSRGALIAMSCALPIYLWRCGLLRKRNALSPWIVALPILIVIVTMIAWFSTNLPFKAHNVSISKRGEIQRTALKIFAEHPLLGSGPGSFSDQYLMSTNDDTTIYRAYYVHNDYLQILTEHGFIGIALALAFLIIALIRVRNSWPRADYLNQAAAGALLFAMIHALFDFSLRIPLNSYLVAMILALAMTTPAAPPALSKATAQNTSSTPALGLQLLFFILVATALLLTLYPSRLIVGGTRALHAYTGKLVSLDFVAHVARQRPYVTSLAIPASRALRQDGRAYDALNIAMPHHLMGSTFDSSVELARTLDQIGNQEAAEIKLKEALRRDPHNTRVHELLGVFYLKHRRYNEAIGAFRTYLARLPHHLEAVLGRFKANLTDPIRLRSLVPNDTASLLTWLRFLRKHGLYEHALQQARENFGRTVKCSESFQLIAVECLVDLKRTSEARKQLALSRRTCPDQGTRYYLLSARIHAKERNGGSALSALERVLTQDPESVEALAVGRQVATIDDATLDGWRRLLQKTLRLEPDSEALQLALIDAYRKLGRWRKALGAAKSLVSRHVRTVSYRYLLANIYLERDLFGPAMTQIETAIGLEPNYASHYLRMHSILIGLDQPDEARKWLETGLQRTRGEQAAALHKALSRLE